MEMPMKTASICKALAIAAMTAFSPYLASAAQSKGDPLKGKQAFAKATCIICHADGGNSTNPSRPLKGPGFLKRHPTDSSIEQVIRKGSGFTGMPAFWTRENQRRNFKRHNYYIRSLTPKSSAKPKERRAG